MFQKIVLLFLLQFASCDKSSEKLSTQTSEKRDYSAFHKEAVEFCKKNKYNQDYYFLIDLSIHSGKNRFFVYDFNEKKISKRNLVTHGSCDVGQINEKKWEEAKFSNADNSHCSSKGKYKIGKRDSSSWGIKVKYWLHGLEKSNANAINRVVVLHSWTAVSDNEIYPRYSPLSWGCPAVSDDFMRILDAKLQKSEKPVLLWIID
jgi:hypothetical protein